jgi:hypothetical protein
LTGPKRTKRRAVVTTALSPHSRDVRHVGHNRGATDDRGDPTRERPTRCVVCAHPRHARTDPPEPPRHTEPQPTTASHHDRPQLPQRTTHNTPNYDRLRCWSRDTAHGPTAPTAPDTLRHPTRLSPQRSWARPGHTSAPCTSQAHSTQGKSRRLPTPMHQPGPPHASADGAPRPFPCHAALTRQLAHNTRQRHSTAPLPPTSGLVAEPRDAVAPPGSYRPLPMLPTHCRQFAGDVGAQVGHGSSGGEATFTRAAAAAALRPPPPRGAGQFTLLISTLI